MAGSVPVIVPNSITGIRGLSSKSVYFLKLNNEPDESLVVKGDSANANAEVSIKWGSKLMKNVNNVLVNTKIMTAAEIAIFKQAVVLAFPANSPQRTNAGPGTSYTWVKMPMVAGLSHAGFLTDDPTPKAKDIKATIAKFLDEAVWTDLGKVVAVDIFNANNDRFQVLSGDGSPPGSWNNKGNVMFVAAGPTKVIGLDTFDPASDHSDLTRSGHYDELNILRDPVRRNAFATACVKDVGDSLKKAYRFADAKPTAVTVPVTGPEGGYLTIAVEQLQNQYLPYAENFGAGIAAGADQLRIYLQSKVKQYRPAAPAPPWQRARPGPLQGTWQNAVPGRGPARVPAAPAAPVKTIPQGVLDRMTFLGWLV